MRRAAHRPGAGDLADDLDGCQPRFGEHDAKPSARGDARSSAAQQAEATAAPSPAACESLAALDPAQRRAHVEAVVMRVVLELTGAPESV
eukprot:2017030-Prymnesium_polylepis.1